MRNNESLVRDFAKRIGQAVEYLHDNGIILRNLQTDGIHMSENTEHGAPKITVVDRA